MPTTRRRNSSCDVAVAGRYPDADVGNGQFRPEIGLARRTVVARTRRARKYNGAELWQSST